jgi:hypothetical protein
MAIEKGDFHVYTCLFFYALIRFYGPQIGERTSIRATRLVAAFRKALETGEPLRIEESDARGTNAPLSPGPRLEWRGLGDAKLEIRDRPEIPQRPKVETKQMDSKTPNVEPRTPIKERIEQSEQAVPSMRRRISEIFRIPGSPTGKSKVKFGDALASPVTEQPPIVLDSTLQATTPKRKPPPKSEALSTLLRTLSAQPSPSAAAPSPGTLIATAKTPADGELSTLANEIGSLHAGARNEMGMRTPFVFSGSSFEEEVESSESSSGSDEGEGGSPTKQIPVVRPNKEVGTRSKVQRKGFGEGAKQLFRMGKGPKE